MLSASSHELCPSFCYAHQEYAPCMYCLTPEVAQMALDRRVDQDVVLFFMKVDKNLN